MALGMEVGLGLGHIVLDGDLAPLAKKGAESPSSIATHFYCGQTSGCIKMPLGMEAGLTPSDFMLDEDPAPLPQKWADPQFSAHVYCAWANGCMDQEFQDATWYGGRPRPTQHCVRYGLSLYFLQPTQFWPMSIVAKWLDG